MGIRSRHPVDQNRTELSDLYSVTYLSYENDRRSESAGICLRVSAQTLTEDSPCEAAGSYVRSDRAWKDRRGLAGVMKTPGPRWPVRSGYRSLRLLAGEDGGVTGCCAVGRRGVEDACECAEVGVGAVEAGGAQGAPGDACARRVQQRGGGGCLGQPGGPDGWGGVFGAGVVVGGVARGGE